MSKAIMLATLSALLLFLPADQSLAQNIVRNGDFEGTTFNQTYGSVVDILPSSWGLSPVDNSAISNCNVVAGTAGTFPGPESGTHYMAFASRENDTSQDCLNQALPTTAGQKYLITFSVAITGGPINSTSFLRPEWDQGGTDDVYLTDPYYYYDNGPTHTASTTVGPVPYRTFTFIETASKSSTTFYFHGVDAGGAASGGAILVDNFSVVPYVAPGFTSSAPTTTGSVGVPYNYTMTPSGSPSPTFAVTTNALPTGLTLSPTGAISGSPTTPGVFTGTVTAGNGAGVSGSSVATQNFTITIYSTYTSWATQEGLTPSNNSQTAVVSPDGITNLVKYALGLNPFTTYNPSSSSLPVAQTQPFSNVDYLTFTFTGVATDVTYTVQVTNDPSNSSSWSPLYTYKGAPPPGTVVVKDSQPESDSTQRFMRLLVSP